MAAPAAPSQAQAQKQAQKQAGKRQQTEAGYPITPVPFTSVKVTDAFWGQRLKASREVTIPLAFSKCEETGRYRNFQMAAHPSPDNKVTGYSFMPAPRSHVLYTGTATSPAFHRVLVTT